MVKLPFRRRKPKPEAATVPPSPYASAYGPPPDEDDGHELRMGILEHLNELRKRLTRVFLALVIGTTLGLLITEPVFQYLRQPYCNIVETSEACELVVLGPTGSVVNYFRVALLLGAAFAIPLVTYQAMAFIVPGLTRREKRLLFLSLPAITLLFVIGVLFAWFVLIPPALTFLENFQADIFRPEWTADAYFGFITALIFWMGVAFETPLVFFVLSLLGLVGPTPMLRNWRIAIVGAAIAAAMITPTIDPVNMFLVMGPLLTLYALSILLVLIGRRISGVDKRT